MVEGTHTGNSTVYNCVPGFVYTFGDFTHTCTSGGLWEGDSPVCSGNICIFLMQLLCYTVKPAYTVTSIKQSPVLKGHLFLVLS